MEHMSFVNDYFSKVAVLPKRQVSRRKAKENSKLKKSLKMLEDEEEVQDIDLTDSDDDATWTPFKDKEALAAGAKDSQRVSFEDDEDDEEEEEEEEGFVNKKSGFKKINNMALPQPTNLVPDGKDFNIGDFMVLRSDAERDSAPLWR